jgi:hypothetical protein
MDTATSGYVEWSEILQDASPVGADGLPPPLYLSEDYAVQIRLVGQLYRLYKYYIPIIAISPGPGDACWKAGFRPRKRYATLVLDRQHGNALKYLEQKPLFFERLYRLCGGTSGASPSGLTAPDWSVRIETPWVFRDGKSYRDLRNSKRTIERLQDTALTLREARLVEAHNLSLGKIHAPAPLDLIEEMLKDVKTLGHGDPIPGSSAWWQQRDKKP